MKAKFSIQKGDQNNYTLWDVKFLLYFHTYEFDPVLEKGVNLPKKKKMHWICMSWIGVMLLRKQKLKLCRKMMAMAYITMAFEMNTAMNHFNECKSSYWPNKPAVKLLDELRKWAQLLDQQPCQS